MTAAAGEGILTGDGLQWNLGRSPEQREYHCDFLRRRGPDRGHGGRREVLPHVHGGQHPQPYRQVHKGGVQRHDNEQWSSSPGASAYLDIRMSPIYGIVPGGGSGIAQTIAFLGADPDGDLGLRRGREGDFHPPLGSARLPGLPIDAAHAVNISFSTPSGPGGGEYVSPPIIGTSDAGQAVTTLNAGTRSGGCRSGPRPPRQAHDPLQPGPGDHPGGIPRPAHGFPLPPVHSNFPALGLTWENARVTVLAGDVQQSGRPGTADYFRTSAGVIQPSVFTNKDGQGTVQLISGNPMPIGTGFLGHRWLPLRRCQNPRTGGDRHSG